MALDGDAVPDPLDELDALLLGLPCEDEGLLLSGVDGLIAAVLVLPAPPAADEWVKLIWGEGEQAFPDDAARGRRLIELVMARKTEVVGELLRGGGAYGPLFDVDELRDEILWETWIDGFARGVALREAGWRALLNHDDPALRAAALDLDRLIAVDRREPMPRREREALTEEAPDMIPLLVETLYRGLRRLPGGLG